MTIDEINALEQAEFIDLFGSIYEHSPWVAEAAVMARPFLDAAQLVSKMDTIVNAATNDQKLTLLRAHPELAGKAAIDGTLTNASKEEQASAGLNRMLPSEFDALTSMNAAYNERFGFPFIICVKLTDKAGILEALRARLDNSRDVEFHTALGEVAKIAQLRLEGMMS
ncbi:MAG: 2-oxo-4-hydroxy-4-carboxy-5-ureidoimidazoline decarboxylase [Pseudomonadota bacterium]